MFSLTYVLNPTLRGSYGVEAEVDLETITSLVQIASTSKPALSKHQTAPWVSGRSSVPSQLTAVYTNG